uniref:Uncharacterized protein n=1 Tax=Ditylenchus dipsaci TaxID=166011 RepID=A0A915DQT1_9BILA
MTCLKKLLVLMWKKPVCCRFLGHHHPGGGSEGQESDEDFECFCIATLISALICQKLGTSRRYPEESNSQKSPPPAVNHHRRRLCLAAAAKFRAIQPQCIKFSMDDLWDGRLVYGIYKRVASKTEVLPYRLQEEFAQLHKAAALSMAVPTDVKDALIDPTTPVEDQTSPVQTLKMFQVDSELLNEFIPELQQLTKTHPVDQHEANIADVFASTLKWRFTPIVDKMLTMEEPKVEQAPTEKPLKQEAWRIRRAIMRQNRQRQTLSRWYQNFADSLEGRGNDLLVDFARTPGFHRSQKAKEGGSAAKGKKGSKAPKEPQLSKKDQILKANRDVMNKKQVESDKTKIAFATQVKANAISSLEEVFRKLEFAEIFIDKLSTYETLEQKRNGALDLVEAIKSCLVKHMNFLEEPQREKVRYLWVSLGFVKSTPSEEATNGWTWR